MKFKKNKKTNIRYFTDLIFYKNPFISAKMVIPDWYKNTSKYSKDHNPNRIPYVKSFKSCVPFLESFATGYVLTTPCDIAVDNLTDIDTVITWNETLGYVPVSIRIDLELNNLLPIPEGFSSQHFVWVTHVYYEIPEGYSALITHPLNRHDLPFTTLSAIVDGRVILQKGNVPVFFNKSFNGIIPKGTPFAQIIPFKRENWNSKEDPLLFEEVNYNTFFSRSTANNWYKLNFWRKKTYN